MRRVVIFVILFTFILSILVIPQGVYGETVLPNRLLSLGSQGPDVIKLQEALNQLGYVLKIDGFYGQQTKQAILSFQKNNSQLSADGVYGPNTGTYLMAALAQKAEPGDEQTNSEENVNENLSEDKALTYNAEKSGLSNVVSQDFIEANRDKLTAAEGAYPLLKEWNTVLPEGLQANIKYNQYPMAYDYFLVNTGTLNIRALPNTASPVVKKAKYLDKINLIQEVQGQYLDKYGSDSWYRVFYPEKGEIKFGYVFSKLGVVRSFRFDKMLENVKTLQQTVAEAKIGYISNYKNVNGYPPAYKGANKDAYGIDRSQSAPGYTDLTAADFRYFPDGMVLSILEESGNYYKVSTPTLEGEYFIPKKYVSFRNAPKELKKVIVVDDLQQNEGVFEFVDGQWQLDSYSYATTGIENQYSYETPKGYFMAIEKKSYFLYLEDGTDRISGFAPYAIRFSGGGYIHGVPVDFAPGQDQHTLNPTDPLNQQEYLFTIGTTPRSHKCVRNFTSHAKFLYDWAQIGSTMVLVID